MKHLIILLAIVGNGYSQHIEEGFRNFIRSKMAMHGGKGTNQVLVRNNPNGTRTTIVQPRQEFKRATDKMIRKRPESRAIKVIRRQMREIKNLQYRVMDLEDRLKNLEELALRMQQGY